MKTLLDFIAKYESHGDYNIVNGRIRPRDKPPQYLVNMTISDVLAWQDRIDPHYLSEAAGKYQIMEDTLRGLWREAGMSLSDLFDEDGQDKLATHLLKRRGLDEFMSMRISGVKFANNIAKEWAAMPLVSGPKVGQSYYQGDKAGNKAGVSHKDFLAAVMAIRNPPQRKYPWLNWLNAIDLRGFCQTSRGK